MGCQGRTLERQIASIADRQHGAVARRQLLAAGISAGAIQRRLDRGDLVAVYPGVYRVGHSAPSVLAHYMAAVLACGEGSLLSGRAAAYLQRLIRGTAPQPEVTTPSERRIAGIRTRRARRGEGDGAVFRGIPATTVPRTLVDLAAALDRDELARACHEAGVLYRTTPAQVEAVLSRRPTARGAATLRAVMRGDVRVTLSTLERRFLELLRENGLPLPETNRSAGGRRVDCRWPAHRLTVELDSYRYHSSRHAWEQDRHREREAHARGDDHHRYTRDDVMERPTPMLRELRSLLGSVLPGHRYAASGQDAAVKERPCDGL